MNDINGERLLDDLRDLSAIGGRPDGGIDRLAWGEADLEGRRWFAGRLRDAGLEVRTDQALNVFGHLPGAGGPFLLTGSHLDSVPSGGRLDGAYGAVAALEVLRTLVESKDPVSNQVEVVGFADEEGVRFESGLIGSKALCGELDLERLSARSDWTGVPIPDVLRTAGVDIARMNDARSHLPQVARFLELHIEQGPRMEASGTELGVVTGIVNVHRELITISGMQNHAGTTPLNLRHDAGRAAARITGQVKELVQSVDHDAVANVGVMRFEPGAVNVIPGRAEFTLELRHLDEAIVRQITERIHDRLAEVCGEESCRFEISPLSDVSGAAMDPVMMATLDRVCAELGRRHRRLWSGAGHDAQVLAKQVPTGMLFVPSRKGISHAPGESTDDAHLVLGVRALLAGVRAILANS
ncbi:MAG: Zn-dependent hydrolase [Candidatus Dormibacteraeota bacterium]|nr:Zn-dependent hydrolase [Candidatus Dormibacteraeota bacterium]